MLRLTAGTLLAGWLLLVLVLVTGNMIWDNRLLYVPPLLFGVACLEGAIGATEEEEHRGLQLLLAAVALCSFLAFALFYVFFVFGPVGH